MVKENIYIPRGKEVTTKEGYILVYCPEYPYAKQGKYVFKHRLVMANYIGRPLTPDEHVHHINGNKQDNRIENLMIISNSEHKKLHMRQMSDADKKQMGKYLVAYSKTRRKKRELIPCACGCGEMIESVDRKGRERRYAHGHNNRGKHWKWNERRQDG